MIRKLLVPGLVGVSLFLSGCYEETDTVTVYPDGSGVLHIHKKFGEGYSNMVTSSGTRTDLQSAIDKALYKELSLWKGFDAWTGVKASMDGKLVVNDAVGYFSDVSKLTRTEGTTVQAFTWVKNVDGGFTIAWSNIDSANKNPLDAPPTPPAQEQQIMAMVKGLKADHVIVLPGAVASAKGCIGQSGRTATAELNDKNIADYYAIVDDYRARVAKGDITKDKANEDVASKARDLSMNMEVTCGPGDVDAEMAQFRKDFENAKADYSSAGTEAKIQDGAKSG